MSCGYMTHRRQRYLARLAQTTPVYLLTATSLSPCFHAVESNPFFGGGSPRGESERRGRFLQHERHKKSKNTARHRRRRCVSRLSRGDTHGETVAFPFLNRTIVTHKRRKPSRCSMLSERTAPRSCNKGYEYGIH